MTDKQPRLFETMQCRVDRSLREIERLAASASDFLDHCVAMRWPRRQGSQHDQVEVPLEHFAFHALRYYALAAEGSTPKGRVLQIC